MLRTLAISQEEDSLSNLHYRWKLSVGTTFVVYDTKVGDKSGDMYGLSLGTSPDTTTIFRLLQNDQFLWSKIYDFKSSKFSMSIDSNESVLYFAKQGKQATNLKCYSLDK